MLFLLASCQQEREPASREHRDVLRVSTSAGLLPMSPTVTDSLTAQLTMLVYPVELKEHFASLRADGQVVHLKLRRDSRLPGAELVRLLRHPVLIDAKWQGDEVVMRLADASSASALSLDDRLLELGPFHPTDYSEGRLLLTREGPGLRTIEVIDAANEDVEWRRMMAGDVDLVLRAMFSAVPSLAEIPELRVVPLLEPTALALHFRVDAGPTADLRLRQAISLALRRGPLAEIGTLDAGQMIDMKEDLQAARGLVAQLGRLPALRVLVPADQSDTQRVALVVQQQLASANIEVELISLGVADLVQRIVRRDFELVIFFGAYENRYLTMVSGEVPGNMSNFQDADFVAAMTRGDQAAAVAVMAREMPLTPLFHLPEVVVVNRRFCEVKPVVSWDLSWLTEVRLCAPGEDE